MTTSPAGGDYDAYAEQYAPNVAWREQGGVEGDPFGILPTLLELVGDVSGHRVLDAGCGEGYLARALAARGAQVTGIDISPRLIELARKKNASGGIDYQVADLSQPIADRSGSFDTVASYLVLNDVPDYQGFADTIAAVLTPGGRAVLAFNNPYGGVIHRHVTDYFDSGAISPYRGMWTSGIKTYYHHRTLENYLDAFLAAGLRLTKLADLRSLADDHPPHALIPDGISFPRFMLLGFAKPGLGKAPGLRLGLASRATHVHRTHNPRTEGRPPVRALCTAIASQRTLLPALTRSLRAASVFLTSLPQRAKRARSGTLHLYYTNKQARGKVKSKGSKALGGNPEPRPPSSPKTPRYRPAPMTE
jgi:2-polyprenyl-3-methyl-5-hydroxy-6-metoxy-1,4-benzoquinol methylase